MPASTSPRVFKSAWFAKAAKKARISDAALCTAIAQVMAGQADDLGGGVYKKRLGNNHLRSIILARGGDYWVYQYLFAKRDRANIDDDELRILRAAAREYAKLTAAQADHEVAEGRWIELTLEQA